MHLHLDSLGNKRSARTASRDELQKIQLKKSLKFGVN